MTWLSARTLRTMSELQRQYALSCLDTVPSLTTLNTYETSYNTSKCRLLYTQMHSTDPVRCFKASQAWSIAHFLYHTHLECDVDASSGDREMAVKLLEKPGMLGMEEIERQFVWNERLVVGVGWIWLVRPYPPSLSVKNQKSTQQSVLQVIRVPAGRPPTTCPTTQSPCLPIIGVNLWEHAYCADFGTDRAGFVKEWWRRVRWERVVPVLAGAAVEGGGHTQRVHEEQWVRYAS